MADSTIPFEERETLISVLANSIGYSLYGGGRKKVSSDVMQKLKDAARACLDTLEQVYILEEKSDGN